MAFSSTVGMVDLDYIAPSQACIKPTVMKQKLGDPQKAEASRQLGGSSSTDDGMGEAIKITLQDCLACSGCITTAETMLVTQQSRTAMIDDIAQRVLVVGCGNSDPVTFVPPKLLRIVVTVSDQTIASLSSYFGIVVGDTLDYLDAFLNTVVATEVRHRLLVAATEAVTAGDIARLEVTRGAEPVPAVADPATLAAVVGATEMCFLVIDLRWAHHLSLLDTAKDFTVRLGLARGLIQPTDAAVSKALQSAGVGAVADPRQALPLPLMVSACPGWVCYAEKTHPFTLPHISRGRSAQAIASHVLKGVIREQKNGDITSASFIVSLQPCFDKKLEAARAEYRVSEEEAETDCVLSSVEMAEWIEEIATHAMAGSSFSTNSGESAGVLKGRSCLGFLQAALEGRQQQLRGTSESALASASDRYHSDPIVDLYVGCSVLRRLSRGKPQDEGGVPSTLSEQDSKTLAMTGSGGYHQFALAFAAKRLYNVDVQPADFEYQTKRNRNHQTLTLNIGAGSAAAPPPVRICVAYGFQQLQNIIRNMKKSLGIPLNSKAASAMLSTPGAVDRVAKDCGVDLIELMACPDGCMNGGGQVKGQPLDAVQGAARDFVCGLLSMALQDGEEASHECLESAKRRRFTDSGLLDHCSVAGATGYVARCGGQHEGMDLVLPTTYHDRQAEADEITAKIQSLKW